jgi:hypothetical protein
MMRKFITTGALFLAVGLIPAALPTHAQSTPDSQASPSTDNKPAQSASGANPDTTTVTGCIQAGKREGTFKLVGDDGSVYMLRSKKTDFSQHVGHEVTITGNVMNGNGHMHNGGAAGAGADASAGGSGADQSAPASDAAMTPKAHAWKGLAVKSMSMVSETCKNAK